MGDHWRIAPRLCMAWSGRRFAPHRPVRGPVGGIPRRRGPRLLLKELDGDPRRISRFASCWRGPARGMSGLLLAEACPRCRSVSRGSLLLAGACPWDVSPPAGGGLSPVQVLRRRNIHLNVNCGIQFLYEDMYIHLKLRSQEEIKIKI
jgi:hypothetical protein